MQTSGLSGSGKPRTLDPLGESAFPVSDWLLSHPTSVRGQGTEKPRGQDRPRELRIAIQLSGLSEAPDESGAHWLPSAGPQAPLRTQQPRRAPSSPQHRL